MRVETNGPEETYELGRRLGEKAKAGQIYCLNGDLGVGKTVFTQGFAKGLGIGEPVNSPTFTIVQEYDEGRLPLYHLTCTASGTSARWTRSGTTTISLGRASA